MTAVVGCGVVVTSSGVVSGGAVVGSGVIVSGGDVASSVKSLSINRPRLDHSY